MHNPISTAIITSGLYALPKVASRLSEAPIEGTSSCFDSVRTRLSKGKKTMQDLLGERAWFITAEVIADNAWVSFLGISILTNGNPKVLNPTLFASAFVSFAALSYVTREGIARIYTRN